MQLAQVLPTLNAVLNAASALLLAAGYWAVRTRRLVLHRALMLAAFGTSSLFLVSYIARFALTGTHRFPAAGLAKTFYLTVLASHSVLAVAVLPLALRTLYLSLLAKRFEAHKRIARWTLPIWLYVSATGVVVYLMLYHLAPRLR